MFRARDVLSIVCSALDCSPAACRQTERGRSDRNHPWTERRVRHRKNSSAASEEATRNLFDGKYDKAEWDAGRQNFGPAARVGDLVQITKVDIEEDEIVLEINGGLKGGHKWYDNVQVGMGTQNRSVRGNHAGARRHTIALKFDKAVPAVEAG